MALVPVDGCSLLATINNPSNSGITLGTRASLTCLRDASGANLTYPTPWTLSGPTVYSSAYALAFQISSAGGFGTSSSGRINVNPAADPYLTLDATQTADSPAVAVNELVALVTDANAAIYPATARSGIARCTCSRNEVDDGTPNRPVLWAYNLAYPAARQNLAPFITDSAVRHLRDRRLRHTHGTHADTKRTPLAARVAARLAMWR